MIRRSPFDVAPFIPSSRLHVESGALELRRAPLELGSDVRQAVAASAAAATARGVTLDADALSAVVAEADETRLMKIMRNLIANALAHTPEGGRVTVRLESAGGEVLVSVADTGVGLLASVLENIFERFYCPDPSRSRSTGGTGLSLAIVRRLVAAHGGRVWAEGTGEGKGSVFTILES